jgi:hypothetical protein
MSRFYTFENEANQTQIKLFWGALKMLIEAR